MRIGINGMGRIGRTLLRTLWNHGGHQVVHANDLNPDVSSLAYLIKYDSNYGPFSGDVSADGGRLNVRGDSGVWEIGCTARSDTREVSWSSYDVEVVIEATGTDENNIGCRDYLDDKTHHIVITHTQTKADATIVFGVNDDQLKPAAHKVISASICDANALSPVIKAIHTQFPIDHVFVTTLHPWLSYQNVVDGPVRFRARPGEFYADYALGRASPGALIPKTTTAGAAIEQLVPELSGRVTSSSYRVPTSIVCYGDLSLIISQKAGREDVVRVLKQARPYVRLTDEPLVSTDLIRESASAVVDTRWIPETPGNHLKIPVGYDNEWGYCSRVTDLLDRIAQATQPRSGSSA